MRSTGGRKSKTAQQMESEMEDRQNIRREEERDQAEDLNQSIQTGTHDTERTGVKWPPSYRTLKKRKTSSKPSARTRK
jgi:hypothetical protein